MLLQQAQGQLERDRAQLVNAQNDLERYRNLLAQDSIAAQQVDNQAALVRQYEAVLVTDRANAARFDHPRVLVLDDGLLDGHPTEHETLDTAADDPAQLYYTSGTTGLAKGIVHAHRYLIAHVEFSLFALIGAIRVARPGSVWARRRYAEDSRKLAKATAREERYGRRITRVRTWFQDLVAGGPSPGGS